MHKTVKTGDFSGTLERAGCKQPKWTRLLREFQGDDDDDDDGDGDDNHDFVNNHSQPDSSESFKVFFSSSEIF